MVDLAFMAVEKSARRGDKQALADYIRENGLRHQHEREFVAQMLEGGIPRERIKQQDRVFRDFKWLEFVRKSINPALKEMGKKMGVDVLLIESSYKKIADKYYGGNEDSAKRTIQRAKAKTIKRTKAAKG